MAADSSAELAARASRAASGLVGEAEGLGWVGPDLYDGLWARWPSPLTAGRRRRQVIIQLHARSPIDVRRLYRRTHPRLTKAVALFGKTALALHRHTGDRSCVDAARRALAVVMNDRAAGPEAWGYPFDTQTRWSFYPRNSPNVVVTAFAGLALAEGAEALDDSALRERAAGAARWVRDELWIEGEDAFAYHAGSTAVIHNASLLGAQLVAAALPGDPLAEDRVRRVVTRALAAQNADGSWPYGEGRGLGWQDSFHTGYVLTSLVEIGDPAAGDAVARGVRHYRETFFDSDGRAALFAGRRWPEDGHSAGTGLSTLAALAADHPEVKPTLEAVADRVLRQGLLGGRAVFRRYRWGRSTVRYLRWVDAHVAFGLARAAPVLGEV